MENRINNAWVAHYQAASGRRRKEGGGSFERARRRARHRERITLLTVGAAFLAMVSVYFLVLG
jgi:hypothetical protein